MAMLTPHKGAPVLSTLLLPQSFMITSAITNPAGMVKVASRYSVPAVKLWLPAPVPLFQLKLDSQLDPAFCLNWVLSKAGEAGKKAGLDTTVQRPVPGLGLPEGFTEGGVSKVIPMLEI